MINVFTKDMVGITDALNRAFEGVKFPIDWDTDYYALVTSITELTGPCSGCDGSGNITLRDESIYNCPKCNGRGERIVPKTKYIVKTYNLRHITLKNNGARLTFEEKNARPWGGHVVSVESTDLATMRLSLQPFEKNIYYLYNSNGEARAEAKKLNAQGGKDA